MSNKKVMFKDILTSDDWLIEDVSKNDTHYFFEAINLITDEKMTLKEKLEEVDEIIKNITDE